MLRPFVLDAQRVAGFALALATALFGWGVLDGQVLPRWLGAGGVAAGAVGMLLALVFREDTKADQAAFVLPVVWQVATADRKSTRLNSSHLVISYAVFCLKKKKKVCRRQAC